MSNYARICIFDASPAISGGRLAEIFLGSEGLCIAAQDQRTGRTMQNASRCEILDVDFSRPNLLESALSGVNRLFIVPAADSSQAGRCQLSQIQAIGDAAVKVGVQHLIYPSVAALSVPWSNRHLASERLIRRTGINSTILRVGALADCVLHRLPFALRSGEWPTSAGSGRASYVSREDVVSAVAAALSAPTLPVGELSILGTQELTMEELVHSINHVFGAHIELSHVDDDALLRTLAGSGVHAPIAAALVAIDRVMRQGNLHAVGTDVKRLLGSRIAAVDEILLERRLDALLASKHGWRKDLPFSRPPSAVQC